MSGRSAARRCGTMVSNPAPPAAMHSTLVDTATLARHLDDPAWVVLDCRFSLADPDAGARAFAASRIPGARHADLERDLSAAVTPGVTGRHPLPDPDTLAARLAALGVSRHSQIVAYDDTVGALAARLWWLAQRLGHEACAVLDGGFATWLADGLPLETAAPSGAGAAGDLRAGTPRVASVDIDAVAGGGLLLLDAREPARFAGEHEPIDPVAGHIPGARNHPFTANVDAAGRFLSPAALRERFAASLGTDLVAEGDAPPPDPRPLVHYCGSGVTAAHNVLAMRHAGLDPGALYAGSFSEWITRHDAATGAQGS